MKKNISKSMPFIIFVAIVYFILLVIVHKEYPIFYTDLFVDEWVVMAVTTILYIMVACLLWLTIRFIDANEERKKRLVFGCIVIGVLLAIITGMNKYLDKQKAERQEQLDELERSKYILEQEQKDKKQMYYKILYKENK